MLHMIAIKSLLTRNPRYRIWLKNSLVLGSLASSNAIGMRAVFGSDAKPLGAGMAASKGIESALLAAASQAGTELTFGDLKPEHLSEQVLADPLLQSQKLVSHKQV